ncbi:SGNH/GDSL hydrolase family protein [Treponema brennaborense]|uniref:Lipolytic protein G-D-S-L family n=1 Tax=Treponema brennaborense (strain DSM 12168 / CIP 105900 / DD5/3) TaxID=906968 RepID=F4LIM0_TREBD|nr:SGNH/GDSL hydrolase family protein [Treponema brennaborense]AEE17245.1 hypothetical protein Trebr_1825 [Treponema brennaborense DSM 12168]
MYEEEAAIAARETVEKAGPAVRVSDVSGVKLYLVGDSTVSPFNDPYYCPRYGYGTKIADYVENIGVVNLALSGRSSKSFTTEANYRVLLDLLKKDDFLMIGFAHNDEKAEAARYTDPNGDKNAVGSFKNSLYENYLKIAFERGAVPILCTPIVRRNAAGIYDGTFIHRTAGVPGFPGGDYAECIRRLGAETGTTVVDLTLLTKSLYERLGPAGTLELHARPGPEIAGVDNTHLNAYGASYVAYLAVRAVGESDNALKKYVRTDRAAPAEPS